MTSGQLAVPGPQAAYYSASALDSFVQGIYHPDLKTPFQLSAWFTNNASLLMHLNSVSDGSVMTVLVDGNTVFSTNLPNLDGTYNVDEEYNTNFSVNLPSGHHLITITNTGADWFYLDWVQLNQVLPATYLGNWQPSPDAIGLSGTRESLLYVIAPGVSFPANATTATLPVQHAQTVTLTNWPAGNFIAEWQQSGASDARLHRRPCCNRLSSAHAHAAGFSSSDGFQFRLNSETGGQYLIQKSSDLFNWTPFSGITNTTGTMILIDPSIETNTRSFFRAMKTN
jgi:hypothetical protein